MASLEIASEVIASVRQELPEASLRVVGGVATFAMVQGAQISVEDRIILGGRNDLPARRPNGTVRDLDLIVWDTDKNLADDVWRLASRASDGRLNMSVHRARTPNDAEREPLKCRHIIDPVTQAASHRLGPFEVAVPASVTQEWTLQLPDNSTLPVFDPVMQYLSYFVRRIRGVHQKDVAGGKLAELYEVIQNTPELLSTERMLGFASLISLADTIAGIQEHSFLSVLQKYGKLAIRARLGTSIVNSTPAVKLYQIAEDREQRKRARKLS